MNAYCNQMSIHKLFAILVAIAVLFAPTFAAAGTASAAVPDHHAQMMEGDHCNAGGDRDVDKSAGKTACCAAMCMAVAVTPAAEQVAKPLLGNAPVAGLRAFQTGVPSELATPPPRVA